MVLSRFIPVSSTSDKFIIGVVIPEIVSSTTGGIQYGRLAPGDAVRGFFFARESQPIPNDLRSVTNIGGRFTETQNMLASRAPLRPYGIFRR